MNVLRGLLVQGCARQHLLPCLTASLDHAAESSTWCASSLHEVTSVDAVTCSQTNSQTSCGQLSTLQDGASSSGAHTFLPLRQHANTVYSRTTTSGHPRSCRRSYATFRPIKNDPYTTPPTNFVQLLQHIKLSRNVRHLAELVKEYGDKFDAVHCAAAITKLPKLVRMGEDGEGPPQRLAVIGIDLLDTLQRVCTPFIPRLFSRQIANITWAIGDAPHLRTDQSHAFVRALLQELKKENCQKLFSGGRVQDAANLFTGLGHLRIKDEDLLERLSQFCQRHVVEMHAKHVAMVAWGSIHLGLRDAALRDALSRQAMHTAAFFRPQGMGLLFWFMALHRSSNPELFSALGKEALFQMNSFKSQDVGMMLWAMGRLGWRDAALETALLSRAEQVLERFSAKGLAMLVQGLKDLRIPAQQLLGAIAASVASEEHVWAQPQQVAVLLHCYGALGHYSKDVANMIHKLKRDVIIPRLPIFGRHELRQIIEAMLALGHQDEELTGILMGQAAQLLPSFTRTNMVSWLVLYAAAKHKSEPLEAAFVKAVLDRRTALPFDDAAHLLLHAARAGLRDPLMFSEVGRELRPKIPKAAPKHLGVLLNSYLTAGLQEENAALLHEAAQRLLQHAAELPESSRQQLLAAIAAAPNPTLQDLQGKLQAASQS